MTATYITPQAWIEKKSDYLCFLFHLTKNSDGVLKVGIKPGTI